MLSKQQLEFLCRKLRLTSIYRYRLQLRLPTNLALCYTPAPPSPALEVEEFDGVDKDRGEHKHPHEYHRADNRQKAVLESKLFIEILFHVDYFCLIANH